MVKQDLLHLFAFKLYLNVYSCGFFFPQACVPVLWISITYPLNFWQSYSLILSQHDLLTTINTVCHYWNEVAFSSSLWKSINITHTCSTVDDLDVYFQSIAHYRDFVQKLVIPSDHLIKFFDIKKNRNLSNLRNLQITDSQHDADVNFCKNIVDLYPGIVAIRLRISKSHDISGYLSVLSNLQLRDFGLYTSIVADTMALNKIICEFISKQCSLQSLSIDCSVLQSDTIIKMLRNLNDLTCLHLSNDNTDVVVGCAVTFCPDLRLLVINKYPINPTVHDDVIKIALKKCRLLETLILDRDTIDRKGLKTNLK